MFGQANKNISVRRFAKQPMAVIAKRLHTCNIWLPKPINLPPNSLYQGQSIKL
jgi:hypothetical protein